MQDKNNNQQEKDNKESTKQEDKQNKKWIKPIPIRQLINKEKIEQKGFRHLNDPFLSLPSSLNANRSQLLTTLNYSPFTFKSVKKLQNIYNISLTPFSDNKNKEQVYQKNQQNQKLFIYEQAMNNVKHLNLKGLYSILLKIFLNCELRLEDFQIKTFELAILIEVLIRKNKKYTSRM